jgi:DNA-binding NarL/FixJ family response regulator
MERVLAGHPSKNIAADLGISHRTVENHRASIMKKTGTRSLPALARWRLSLPGTTSRQLARDPRRLAGTPWLPDCQRPNPGQK